jgi:hypothetical protein
VAPNRQAKAVPKQLQRVVVVHRKQVARAPVKQPAKVAAKRLVKALQKVLLKEALKAAAKQPLRKVQPVKAHQAKLQQPKAAATPVADAVAGAAKWVSKIVLIQPVPVYGTGFLLATHARATKP